MEELVANSLVVEHLEIWEENGHMVGGFLEDQNDRSSEENWMFQRKTEIEVLVVGFGHYPLSIGLERFRRLEKLLRGFIVVIRVESQV